MLNNHLPFETPRFLPDNPLRDSDAVHFHFDQFAITLARLIASQKTRTPLTIGVSGAWGSGKTTLMQRVRKMLEATCTLENAGVTIHLEFCNDTEVPQQEYRLCRTVWFDAWKYAQEDRMLAGLLRAILGEIRKDGLWEQIKSRLSGPQKEEVRWLGFLLSGLSQFASAGTVDLNLSDYITDTPFKDASAFFDYFDESLSRLMASWVGGRLLGKDEIDEHNGVLVVFIDDLDRCLPAKMVQVLEAVKLFLDKAGCIFVLGADTNIIQQAVASHYKDVGVTGESASDYLEKVIQLRFTLPPVQIEAMKGYLEAENVDDAVQRNWQVLLAGAEINPRKVKTFINELNFQWAILRNTGQAQGVNRDDFTCWQILERAAPENFTLRIRSIDDLDLRHKFIQDALRWAGGEASLEATFQEYATSLRLRRVLRQIKSFSQGFTPDVLEAFIHLAAPPEISAPRRRPLQPPELPLEQILAFAQTDEGKAMGRKWDFIFRENILNAGGMEFVKVPAGKFLMGSQGDNFMINDNEQPQHPVDLNEYWIGRFPVTNRQFHDYCNKTRTKFTGVEDWEQKLDHPVVNVTWAAAVQYCEWFAHTYQTSMPQNTIARLPTEAEWEKAARGEYGNEWPWGNTFDASRCNMNDSKIGATTAVGNFSPQGDSPYGAADMVGNVWEWCSSLLLPYPYQVQDGRENLLQYGGRVTRGGCWGSESWAVRCAFRNSAMPNAAYTHTGFRCVVGLPI